MMEEKVVSTMAPTALKYLEEKGAQLKASIHVFKESIQQVVHEFFVAFA